MSQFEVSYAAGSFILSSILVCLVGTVLYNLSRKPKVRRHKSYLDILVGLQNGDEGKGKVTFDLLKKLKYNLSYRFNGGPNAGHTVYVGEKRAKVALHQLPIGILLGIPSIIGPGCVVNFEKLRQEIQDVVEKTDLTEEEILSKLYIAYNAHKITLDALDEDSTGGSIGTTKNGIGQTYGKKYARTGEHVSKRRDGEVSWQEGEFTFVDMYEFVQEFKEGRKWRVLAEGAQGYELDIDHGDYPYVTSSPCLAYYALNCGCFGPSDVRHIFGCSKIYETYVGNKKFQPDGFNFEKLDGLGQEFGATTGRKRQCNFMDLDKLVRSINMNSATIVVVNKCDIFAEFAKESGTFILIEEDERQEFSDFDAMRNYITRSIYANCPTVCYIEFSFSPYEV